MKHNVTSSKIRSSLSVNIVGNIWDNVTQQNVYLKKGPGAFRHFYAVILHISFKLKTEVV